MQSDHLHQGYKHVDQNIDPTMITEEKAKVDFPFDLNNLFSLQYSFDQLKAAIEYLANQQGQHQVLINELLNREPVQVIERTETIVKEASKSGLREAGKDTGIDAGRGSSSKGLSKGPSRQSSAVKTKPGSAKSSKKEAGAGASTTQANTGTDAMGDDRATPLKDYGDDITAMNDEADKIRKQATTTQRLLGSLDGDVDRIRQELADQADRILKLEFRADGSDKLHKKGKRAPSRDDHHRACPQSGKTSTT